MKYARILVSLALIVTVFGCKDNSTNSTNNLQTKTGPSITIGNGTANSWVTTDASGNLNAIGVTVTDAALSGLPSNDTMYTLSLPSGLSIPYKEISLDYATHDEAPYNNPHLDAHFYFWDMGQRMQIMDGMDTMSPGGGMHMPDGYMSMGMDESMMGAHWMDSTAPEMHGHSFQCAFVYGTYHGSMVFVEAMTDKGFLMSHNGFSGTVKRPMMSSGMGMMMMNYPSNYNVSYDAAAHQSNIQISGFTQ